MGVEILPSCVEAAILRDGREVSIAGIMNQRSHRAARGVGNYQSRSAQVVSRRRRCVRSTTERVALDTGPRGFHQATCWSRLFTRANRRRRTGFSTSVNKNIVTPMPITIAPSNGERGCVPNAALNQGR